MVTEAIARLEAKLRRGEEVFAHFHATGASTARWYITLDNNHEAPATDPATPDGREWWCEALWLDVYSHDRQWYVEWPGMRSLPQVCATRSEAIIAAIEAAASALATGAPTEKE